MLGPNSWAHSVSQSSMDFFYRQLVYNKLYCCFSCSTFVNTAFGFDLSLHVTRNNVNTRGKSRDRWKNHEFALNLIPLIYVDINCFLYLLSFLPCLFVNVPSFFFILHSLLIKQCPFIFDSIFPESLLHYYSSDGK